MFHKERKIKMNHIGTKTIETERLVLRKFAMTDAEAMYKNWASDDEVTKFLMWPAHESVEVTKSVLQGWTERYAGDDFYQWAIVYKEYGEEPIGSISVVSLNERVQKMEIGYCMGKTWWHKGIMSEALKAVIEFLFNQVDVQRIESRHDPRNPHSGDVMKKCGMQYEGTLRMADWNQQGICDTCYYSILRSER